ncbi:MAG: hypothetical protein ACREP4_01200 [Stenotrophomonas sp.]|uniref:hypothetical protein n=1 Tax=Stenotrophomonas sp. TaxID=69392 RepID=UPI003D6C8EB3
MHANPQGDQGMESRGILGATGYLVRPLILGPVCFAIGAGVVVLILGIPGLTSAESAGWASAVATVLAVGVALLAIASENRHRVSERNRADGIRNDELLAAGLSARAELERQEAARKSQARRLAKIFDRELTEAARELIALIKLTEKVTAHNLEEYKAIYAEPLRMSIFKMHERFVDHLDVFPDMTAISIVNNMTNWSTLTLMSEGMKTAPRLDFFAIRHKLLAEFRETLVIIGETKTELQTYFADIPGIKMFGLVEIREMNAAKADYELRRLAESAADGKS